MTDDDKRSSDDFDGPWKLALQRFFEPFLAMLFPQVHAEIDWRRSPDFLDKELQKLRRRGQRRHVDALVRVHRLSGEPARVLVHVEVQAQRETGRTFERRMFGYNMAVSMQSGVDERSESMELQAYRPVNEGRSPAVNYRLFDRDEQPVVSLAVLADPSPSWRPNSYAHELCGCGVRMWFPVAKLKDLESRWQELEQSDNPFAMVVMAHLKTHATRGKPEERARWKLALCRMLVERGWSENDILELYRFIEWLMALPADLQQKYKATLEEENMPFVTSWEQRGIEKGIEKGRQEGIEKGIEKGRQEGILAALEVRFGAVPGPIDQAVRAVSDAGLLSDLLRQAIKSSSLEAFEAVLRARAIG